MQHLVWIIAACSLGTFAIRFLPMWWRQKNQARVIPQALERGLAALGYAAILALVIVSSWSQMAVAKPILPIVRVLAAIGAVGLTHHAKKSVILSTVVGVVVFGLLQYFTVR